MKKHALPVLLLLLLTGVALRDYLWQGAFTSHDLNTHTARIAQYYLGLADGHFPVRWAKNLVSGLGYPIFIYIYPLPYLLGSLVYILIRDFEHAAKVVMASSFLASGLAMYWFMRAITNTKAAIIAALLYTWAPYRFSMLFVRGAYAENLAYVFIPIALLLLYRLSQRITAFLAGLGALAVAAIFLSHNLVAVMAAPVLVIYTLWFARTAPKKGAYISVCAGVFALGMALSAFILFSDIWERQHVNFNNLRYYDAHLLEWWQLIRSKWDYGFSMPGYDKDGMSFQIGLLHLAALPFVLSYLRSKLPTRSHKGLVVLSLSIAAVAVLLMINNPVTLALWKTFPFLQIVDFPWRLLGILVFLLAIALGTSLQHAPNVLLGLLFTALLIANRNHLRINQSLTFPTDYYLYYTKDTTANSEFLPRWRNGIQEDVRFHDRVTVERGTASITTISHRAQQLTFVAEATSAALLRVNTLYFPGWQIYVDERPLTLHKQFTITSHDGKSKVDLSGMMHFELPAGRHFVNVRFERTPVRLAGDITSVFALIIVAGLISWRRLPPLAL